MDFLNRVIDYIEDNVPLDAKLRVGRLSSDSNSVSIRPTPASILDRYADEDKTREYSFQILMKDTNQFKVMNKLEEITSLLDGLKKGDIASSNDSFTLVSCKAYVLPNYVEETDREEFIYTAMYTAEIRGGI